MNDAKTLEKPFGWVFFYNSKRFLETGDSHYRFAGNGPIIVNKQDGTVHFFGPKPLIEIIAEYERGLEDTPELPPEEIP